MHMRIALLCFGALLLAAAPGCRKDKENTPEPDAATVTQIEDDNDVKSEGDQANSDVTDALSNFATINGRAAVASGKKVICGCEIDSIGTRTIRLRYDGVTPCGNPSRTRGGTITFQLVQGQQWRFPGSVVQITLTGFRVTRLRDQKSWTFNGVKYLTNVRGHLNWPGYLAGTDSLLYRERARDMSVAFSGGGSASYNIARTTSWRYVQYANRNVIQFAALGDTTLEGKTSVDTWGTGRSGSTFVNQYLNRLVSDSYCGFWRPRSGKVVHTRQGGTITLTMGVNESGQPDTRDCAYGWKVNWNLNSGANGEKIFSY